MIKVNRKSWHFRLTDLWFSYLGKSDSNLCKYFWEVVLSVFISLFVVGAVVGFITIVVIHWQETFLVGLATCFIWVPLVAIFYLRQTGIKTQIENPERINLLSEYLQAKKEKICPIVEFE